MAKYKHVFFDLDNTFYYLEANLYLALEAAFNHLGITPLSPLLPNTPRSMPVSMPICGHSTAIS